MKLVRVPVGLLLNANEPGVPASGLKPKVCQSLRPAIGEHEPVAVRVHEFEIDLAHEPDRTLRLQTMSKVLREVEQLLLRHVGRNCDGAAVERPAVRPSGSSQSETASAME